MKTYILQKHLPNLNAGSELILSCDSERYEIQEDDTKHYFSMYREVVENNPDWFKLKENKFDIQLLVDIDSSKGSEEELLQLVKLWDKFRVQFK